MPNGCSVLGGCQSSKGFELWHCLKEEKQIIKNIKQRSSFFVFSFRVRFWTTRLCGYSPEGQRVRGGGGSMKRDT